MAFVHDYFAADCRERKIRTPELALWIVALDIAKTNAEHLATGRTLDTPSKDIRRRRWDYQYDIADMREWLEASDEGGFLWIGSVLDSHLGAGAFDLARFDAEIRRHLAIAEAELARMESQVVEEALARPTIAEAERRMRSLRRAVRRVSVLFHPGPQLVLPLRGLDAELDRLTRAVLRAKTLPGCLVPREDARAERSVREAPGQGAATVAGKRQGQGREAVATKARSHPRARRVSVSGSVHA